MKKISRKAVIIVFFTGFSYLFSFLFQIILAKNFGAFAVLDSYFAALTLPVLFTTLFSTVLSASILPVFSQILEEKDPEKEKSAAGSITTFFLLFSLVLVLAGEVFAPEIIKIIVPNFDLSTQTLAVNFFRILLPIIFFSSLTQVFSSFHLALNSYVKPSFSLFLNSFSTVVFYLLFRNFFGIWAIAWASTLGAMAQSIFLLPVVIKRNYLTSRPDFKNPFFLKVIALSWPLFLGGLVYRSNNLIERYFASGLGEGKITYLNYGYKMISSVAVIIISGIQTIGFVKFSQMSARKDFQKLKKSLHLSLGVGMIFLLPPFLVAFLFPKQLIAFFLERGNFSHEASVNTALALKYYSPAVVSMALGGLVSSALYALYRTKTVVLINLTIMGLYVLTSWLLISHLNYLGLAISFVSTNWLQFIAYFVLIRDVLDKENT